ncbi:histidine triad nucleotide-binding protein [Tissierella praeacuta]|uniref:histidine triad nucleotide-binding protein n=1 Tax=Tissierella praeacuta TaxID=43131 RepID=UPI0033423A9E
MTDCLFCKIINGEIPSTLIYEDEKVIAFEDINPQAPVHYLVVPKEHIQSADHIDDSNKELIGHIFFVASKIAKDKGLDAGYRIVNNCGIDGGQTVEHIHFHILGKRKMLWPPG